MAIHSLSRSLPRTLTLASLLSRSFTTTTTTTVTSSRSAISSLSLLRPLAAAGFSLRRASPATSARGLSTRATSSSLNDPSPNWSNRPPKETILLDGCDYEHWLVVMDKPEGDPTRDEIIDSYIKTLAKIVGRSNPFPFSLCVSLFRFCLVQKCVFYIHSLVLHCMICKTLLGGFFLVVENVNRIID
jgi:hypothetical protein